MSINREVKDTRLHLRLSERQNRYLNHLVESGRYITKNEALRAMIDKDMEAVPA